MRFLALVKKEFRECLPWMLLAAIAFLTIGGINLGEAIRYGHYDRVRQFAQGSSIGMHEFKVWSPMRDTGPWLIFISAGLGLAVGIRQFWVPDYTRTWGFTVHRSTNRLTVLGAKFAGAVVVAALSLGVTWTLLFWYACQPDAFVLPPTPRVYAEGWVFIACGLVVYLGTALSGLSRVRWYTTKVFGLAFAALGSMALFQWNMMAVAGTLLFVAAVLAFRTIHTFLNREF